MCKKIAHSWLPNRTVYISEEMKFSKNQLIGSLTMQSLSYSAGSFFGGTK